MKKIIELFTLIFIILLSVEAIGFSYSSNYYKIENARLQKQVEEIKLENIKDGIDLLGFAKIQVMAAGHFSHDMPTCDWTCESRAFVPELTWLGENLAKGTGDTYCTKEGVYRAWEASPKHKAVLDEKDIKYEYFHISELNGTCYSVLERWR